jgi:hypothetical protein
MSNKELVRQRPLFADWPTWQQLPTEVRQSVEQLLAQMCLEIVSPCNVVNQVHKTPEPYDEQPTD